MSAIIRRVFCLSAFALVAIFSSSVAALSISVSPEVSERDAEVGGVQIRVSGSPNTRYDIQREGLSDVVLGSVTTDAQGNGTYAAAPGALLPDQPSEPVNLLVVGNAGPNDHALTQYRLRESVADASASLARIPEQLDNHQRMNLRSASAAVTYIDGSGRLKQAWSYWSDDRRAKVVVRDFPGGVWSSPIDIHDAVTGRTLEYDAHNWLGIAVAPNGKLFATGNMHVDPLQMAESTRPWDWSSLVSTPRAALVTRDTDRVTYPDFFTLNNRLYFIYREQEVGGGTANFRYLVKRYLHESNQWETAAELNSGENLRLYVSKVFVSNDGRRAHLLGTWRDDSQTGPSGSRAENNRDVFHLFSDDGTTWQQVGAGAVSLPLWHNNGLGDRGTPVPDLIWDTSSGDPLPTQSANVIVDDDGVLHALLRERGGDNFHARNANGQWQLTRLPWSSSSQTLVAFNGRVGAILSISDRIAYASLDRNHPTWGSPRTLIDDVTNSLYSVRQDWTAQSRGFLSIILTETLNEPVGRVGSFDRDADVFTVPLSWLESTTGVMVDERGLREGAAGP